MGRFLNKPKLLGFSRGSSLGLVFLLALSACTKATQSVKSATGGSQYTATPGDTKTKYPPNTQLSDRVTFVIKNKTGTPIPNIVTEFKLFDVTLADKAGISDEQIKSELFAKWEDTNFLMDAAGSLSQSSCILGPYRDPCLGEISGGTSLTNQSGETGVGYRTPNLPGAVLAIAVRVPTKSAAADLVQFVKIRILSNEEFANSGMAAKPATIFVIPTLFDDAQRQVIKAGTAFNLALFVPDMPNSEVGKGFKFDVSVSGVTDTVDGVNVILPASTVSCEFRNFQCIIPGGPFKVLKPTTITVDIKPVDPNLPVKSASITMPVITGNAKSLVLSLTPPSGGINNVCVNPLDISKPCFDISSDSDTLDLFPIMVDEGGNFVSTTDALWSVTGPLAGHLLGGTTTIGKQTLQPKLAGQGLISVSSKQSPSISTSITYVIRSGLPTQLEVKSQHTVGTSSIENATAPFKAYITLYDKNNNQCIDYNGTLAVSLNLDHVYAPAPPVNSVTGLAQIPVSGTGVSTLDYTTAPLTVTKGQALTPDNFNILKVPNIAGGEQYPSIQISGASGITIRNPLGVTVLPGAVTQTIIRTASGGGGAMWPALLANNTATAVTMASDSQYFLYVAGYDAGGNYVSEVPAKFWGLDFKFDNSTASLAASTGLDDAISSLRALDPSGYGTPGTCPSPNVTPMLPNTHATNQPLNNTIYCGLHRGLAIKAGLSSVFASAGIPGTGKILAIPTDTSVAPSMTPNLSIVSGTATKFVFEMRDASTGATLTPPITAARPFKIIVHAQDNNSIDATGYNGSKDFTVVSSASASWAGMLPSLPSGTVNCTFLTGNCEFPGTYSLADSRVSASITIEQVTAGGVTGAWSKLIAAAPGAAKYIYLADKKGGPAASSSVLTPATNPVGFNFTADDEIGYAVAITDISGNWLRDGNNNTDQLIYEGFTSTANSLAGIFDQIAGTWTSIPAISNLWVADATPADGLDATPKKFYDPAVAGDLAVIQLTANKDTSKYTTVLVPQNRTGSGYIKIRSNANASLVSWPSPWIKIRAGRLEHVENFVYAISNPAVSLNANFIAGSEHKVRVRLHDKKHNQLYDYTSIQKIAAKFIKTDATHPNGVDDLRAGDFSWISQAQAEDRDGTLRDYYRAHDAPELGGPDPSIFNIPGAAYNEGGPRYHRVFEGNGDPFINNWWSGVVPILNGEFEIPGTINLTSGQNLATRNLAAPYDERFLQIDIPEATIDGIAYPPLQSRGGGVPFTGAAGVVLSQATPHAHPDKITVKRTTIDHLHYASRDDYVSPGFYAIPPNTAPTGYSALQIFVDDVTTDFRCAFGNMCAGNGTKTIYWHSHDAAHNYLGPADSAGFAISSNFPAGQQPLSGASGVNGAPSTKVMPSSTSRTVGIYTISAKNNYTNESLWNFWISPGRPYALYANRTGESILTTDQSFGLDVTLVDRYNNKTSFYGGELGTQGDLKFWWSSMPSGSPDGTAQPKLLGMSGGVYTSAAAASSYPLNSFTGAASLISSDETSNFRLVRANEAVTLNIRATDYVNANKTVDLQYNLKAAAGVAKTTILTSLAGSSGLPYKTANFPAIFGNPYPIEPDNSRHNTAFACSVDALGNVGDCDGTSNFSFLNQSGGSQIATQLGGGINYIQWTPNNPGTFKIQAIKGGITGTSDLITVSPAPMKQFKLTTGSLSPSSGILPAGTEIPFAICMANAANNTITSPVVIDSKTVTDPNATLILNIQPQSLVSNAESQTIVYSKASGTAFDGSKFYPGQNPVTFVNGCAQLYAKVLTVGTFGVDLLQAVPLSYVEYFDPNQLSLRIYGAGIKIWQSTALGLDHYVTSLTGLGTANSVPAWASPGSSNTQASAAGNRFNASIYARDLYGNSISVNSTLTLSLLAADGVTPIGRNPICAAPANDGACLTAALNGTSVTVSNLAMDVGGQQMYLQATDGSASIRTSYSTLFNPTTSRKTVKQYVVSAPTSPQAGSAVTVTVTAKDNSGATVVGADADLSSMTYTWIDLTGATLAESHAAPDGSVPILPSSLTFAAGTATASVTLTKAESGLKINIKDNQTAPIQSANNTTSTVSPGGSLKYSLSCTRPSGVADCTGTSGSPYSLRASPLDLFNLTVQAYDQYKNPKASGEVTPVITVNYLSGDATIPGYLEQTPSSNATDGSAQLIINTNSIGGVTTNNLFHRSGNQVIQYSIGSSGHSGLYQTVYHTYQPHIDMVYSYAFNGVTNPETAGTANAISVTAYDRAGNVAKNIDSGLNLQTYTWSGASNAPNGNAPSYPASTLTFSNGQTSGLSVTFRAAESIARFAVTDSYSPSVPGIGGSGAGYTRQGLSLNLRVNHGLPSQYVITSASLSPQAGAAFDVSVTAKDQFDNVATSWSSDTLTFSWNGASSSVTNPKTSAEQTPAVYGSLTRAFTTGAFSTSGTPFVLYRSNTVALTPQEVSTLTVTGTNTATFDGLTLRGTRSFTTQPHTNHGYVRMTTSSAYSAGTEMNNQIISMTTDQSKNIFAHMFDPYGNYKGNTFSVNWSATTSLANKFSPASGNQTLFAPNLPDTGVITAACTGLTDGCISDSTGNVTVSVGNIQKLAFISQTPATNFSQNTEACQEMTIQTQDNSNNAVNVTSPLSVTFTSAGGNGDFFDTLTECTAAQNVGNTPGLVTDTFHSTSMLAGSVTSPTRTRTKSIASGANSVSVWYANRTPVASNGATITAAASSWSATRNATITSGPTKRFVYTTTTPQTLTAASTCQPIAYKFQDKWGNDTPTTSSSTVNHTTSSAGGAFYSDSFCSGATIASGIRTVATSSATDTVYYKDTQANTATLSLLATSTLSSNTALQAQTLTVTVNPGSFGLTSSPNASGSKVKDTVTVNWTAAAGARDYTVSYGTTTACTTTLSTIGLTTANITAGLNSTYYICVRANGYTSGSPGTPQLAATTNTSFNLVIDNTAPTGAVTAPGAVMYIGPLTTAMGSGATTTFAGTAADALSGVQTVQLQLQQGSNYWNGSAWTTTNSWVTATGTTSWSYVINDSDMNIAGDGASYTMTVKVTDASGNITAAAVSKTFTWKNAIPTATLSGTPGNLVSGNYYSNSTNLGVTVGGTLVTNYKYAIVSGASCGTPTYGSSTVIATNITGSPGADGQYTLCVLGLDQAENVQATPTSFTWYKDTAAPVISSWSATPAAVNAAYTPTHTVADAGAPTGSVITYAWTTQTASNSCTVNYSPSAAVSAPAISLSGCTNNFGTPILKLTVTDSAGTSANNTFTLNWDQNAPTISSVLSSLNAVSKKSGDTIPVTVTFAKNSANSQNVNVNTAGGTPSITLNTTPSRTATYASGSGTATLTFNYTIQDGDTASTLNVASASALVLNGGTIKDSIGSGNSATLTLSTTQLNTKNIVIDTTAPTLTFASGLPGSRSKQTALNVAISSTDTNTYKYAVIKGGNTGCASATLSAAIPVATNITTDISNNTTYPVDDNVTICALATDLAGNQQATATSYTWIKDVSPPSSFAITAPTGQISTMSPTITWGTPAADVSQIDLIVSQTSGCASNVVEKYTVADGNALSGSSVSKRLTSALADGTYYICMYAYDVAQNKTALITSSFELETDVIHVSWTDSGGIKYGQQNQTSSWFKETVDSGAGTYNARTSLALDNTGLPYVSYSVNDATNTYMRYRKRTGAATWASASTVNAAANVTMSGVGSFNEIGIGATSTVFSAFFGYDSGTPSQGLLDAQNTTIFGNAGAAQIAGTNAASFMDMAFAQGTSNSRYGVASWYNGTNWILKIQNLGTSLGGTVTLPANCADAPYVSAFSKNSDTVISLAIACRMSNDNTCRAQYGEATYTGTGANFTYSAWTDMGVIKSSSCVLADLSTADRPVVVYDRVNSKVSAVYRNQSTRQIIRWTNESDSNVAETVLTGSGVVGFQSIAVDKTGKSYITYLDGAALRWVTNNARVSGTFTGGWTSISTIESGTSITGVGTIGITGMKGRGNTTNGQ